jgi:hypothetical protein
MIVVLVKVRPGNWVVIGVLSGIVAPPGKVSKSISPRAATIAKLSEARTLMRWSVYPALLSEIRVTLASKTGIVE